MTTPSTQPSTPGLIERPHFPLPCEPEFGDETVLPMQEHVETLEAEVKKCGNSTTVIAERKLFDDASARFEGACHEASSTQKPDTERFKWSTDGVSDPVVWELTVHSLTQTNATAKNTFQRPPERPAMSFLQREAFLYESLLDMMTVFENEQKALLGDSVSRRQYWMEREPLLMAIQKACHQVGPGQSSVGFHVPAGEDGEAWNVTVTRADMTA